MRNRIWGRSIALLLNGFKQIQYAFGLNPLSLQIRTTVHPTSIIIRDINCRLKFLQIAMLVLRIINGHCIEKEETTNDTSSKGKNTDVKSHFKDIKLPWNGAFLFEQLNLTISSKNSSNYFITFILEKLQSTRVDGHMIMKIALNKLTSSQNSPTTN